MIQVYGDILDEETRCQHYHSERDIIAKCFACQKYYPCFLCHDRYEDHASSGLSCESLRRSSSPLWPLQDRVDYFSVHLGCEDACPSVLILFNPVQRSIDRICFRQTKYSSIQLDRSYLSLKRRLVMRMSFFWASRILLGTGLIP